MATPLDPAHELSDLEDARLPLHNIESAILEDDPLNGNVSLITEKPTQSSSSRTRYLDGLRGLAALCVYFYHHFSWFYGPLDDLVRNYGANGKYYFFQLPFVRVLLTGGSAAVCVFFVLSGFVLSVGPLRKLSVCEGSNEGVKKVWWSLVDSAVRRPFRLYLPVAGVSLGFAVVMHLPFGLAPKLGWPTPERNLFLELRKWVTEFVRFCTPAFRPEINSQWFIYDPPAYTIPVELVGSFVIFGLMAGVAKINMGARAFAFGVLGVVLLWVYQWAMACFCFGMLLAVLSLDEFNLATTTLRQLSEKKIKLAPWILPVLTHQTFFLGWFFLSQPAGIHELSISYNSPGFYYLTALMPPSYTEDREYWKFYHTIGATLLVFGILRIGWLQSFFSTRPLEYLGHVSFALYLIHAPLLWTFADRVYRFFGQIQQTDMTTWWDGRMTIADFGIHGVTTRFLISQAVILPVNLLVAQVVTRWLDEPSVRLGRWIVKRIGVGSS